MTASYLRLTSPSTTVTNRIVPTTIMSNMKFLSGCELSGDCCGRPSPSSPGAYIFTAPNVAVDTIWLIASRLGSVPSVLKMCLLPKRVAPLHAYLRAPRGRAQAWDQPSVASASDASDARGARRWRQRHGRANHYQAAMKKAVLAKTDMLPERIGDPRPSSVDGISSPSAPRTQ